MNERDLHERLMDEIPSAFWSNVESGTTCPGFPDLHYTLKGGKTGVIELKYIPKIKERERPMRAAQLAWWREHDLRGGAIRVLVGLETGNVSDRLCLYESLDDVLQMNVAMDNNFRRIIPCLSRSIDTNMSWLIPYLKEDSAEIGRKIGVL